jgi:hypothetical protein
MKKFFLLFAVVAMCASTAVFAQDGDKKASEPKAKTECCASADKKDADKKCCKEANKDAQKDCANKDADKKCCKGDSKATADSNKSSGKK